MTKEIELNINRRLDKMDEMIKQQKELNKKMDIQLERMTELEAEYDYLNRNVLSEQDEIEYRGGY